MKWLFLVALAALAWFVYRKIDGPPGGAGAAPLPPSGDDVADYSDALERKWEGLQLKTYPDLAGHPTIGFGHKLQPGESYPGGISVVQAEALLKVDLDTAAAVRDHVKVPLGENQFSALLDWFFNLGAGKVAGSTLLAKLNAGDYAAVPSELGRWDYVGGQPSDGLASRRADEIALWNS